MISLETTLPLLGLLVWNATSTCHLPSSKRQSASSSLGNTNSKTPFGVLAANNSPRYLLMQIPSNLFLNKFGKPAIYLPACVRLSLNISVVSYHSADIELN